MKKIYASLLLAFSLISATFAQAPFYNIAQINHQNSTTGVADSLNKRYTLGGIVYGSSLAATGKLLFFINDGTGAISVYSSHGWSYTVTEGDSVVVIGTLTQYGGVADCGQLEIKSSVATVGDTIYRVGTGPLLAPEVVTVLDEAHESHLVRANGLTLSNVAEWTNSATGFSVHTTQNVKLYINKYTNAINVPSPGTSPFDIIGMESQYDTSAPYTEFYSMSPRYAADIITSTGIDELNSNPLRALVFPNPASQQLAVSFMAEKSGSSSASIYDLCGRELKNETMPITEGENRKYFSVLDLPTGLYLLKIKEGTSFSTVKFSVVR